MAAKKTGISHDLIIHPGETIADILEERGITQAELAVRTGVSPAYVSNVIAGKKGISANFAMGLEYALGVPKSFWLNLQANYEAELLAANEQNSVTEEEQQARDELRDVVKYLRRRGMMPKRESKIESVLSLRKALQISNIENLKEIAPAGAFRMSANSSVNPLVLGAWIRLCQISGDNISVSGKFDLSSTVHLVEEIKNVMCRNSKNFVTELKQVMGGYGIEFSVVQNFRGAPVHGYISKKNEEINYSNIIISEDESKTENKIEEEIIKVYVTGEVKSPGVIELEGDSRIEDAITLAGGITEKANLSEVNLAYSLEDGQKLYIPSIDDKEEVEYLTTENGENILETNKEGNGKININTASLEKLETLPGVGEALGKRIIEYREENGKFEKIEDLKNVSGIGDKKFESLEEYIVVK